MAVTILDGKFFSTQLALGVADQQWANFWVWQKNSGDSKHYWAFPVNKFWPYPGQGNLPHQAMFATCRRAVKHSSSMLASHSTPHRIKEDVCYRAEDHQPKSTECDWRCLCRDLKINMAEDAAGRGVGRSALWFCLAVSHRSELLLQPGSRHACWFSPWAAHL